MPVKGKLFIPLHPILKNIYCLTNGTLKNSTAFECFFKENYSQFYYYAYQLTDEEEVSKDIVSDGFEYAWRHFQDEQVENWKAYMCSFIHNKSIDYLRHQIIKEKYAELYLSMADEKEKFVYEEADERIEAIRKILRKLPQRTQFIMQECYMQNKKYKEVAEELEISINAVKQHIVKALKIIREELKKTPYGHNLSGNSNVI